VAAVAALGLLMSSACGEDQAAAGDETSAVQLIVNNHSSKLVEVFVDDQNVGTIEAQANGTFEGAFDGQRELYARATDGSAWWGPVEVTIEQSSTHTWNLWE
jgi:hypothetical protein